MTITVSDGETLSIPAGERTVSETINLSGSVTLDGALDLQATTTEAAAGVGDGVGTATTTRTYTASNTPVQPIGVDRGETLAIAAGDERTAASVDLRGSITLDGTLSVVDSAGTGTGYGRASRLGREATAAGTGTGIGTATPLAVRPPVASGTGTAAGAAAAAQRAAIVALGEGTGLGTAAAQRARTTAALGEGAGVGTAIDGAFRAVIAAGDGDAVGSGTPIVAVPAVRREEATLVYDDRDEFDLGLDT